tara:strand:+ start:4632 stop:4946 length:315 start_codon:yes stop_codon:yes gene_type:complete
MTIKGKLIKKLDVERGTSKAGKEWQRQSILVDQGGEYNKEVVVGFFGDKMKQLRDLEEGSMVDILVNIYSREFKGKYYHSIDGYAIANLSGQEASSQADDDMPF